MMLLVLLGECFSFAADFYVSPLGTGVPPFADWSSAATNIQDAIEAASAGDVVWVTNGTYSNGGKAITGTLTNVVALDKALRVESLNGPSVTRIVGNHQNRCAWLTNGAMLNGFTLRWGTTQNSGDATLLESGGGVWCAAPSAIVTNCYIMSCTASFQGGGAYVGTLKNCWFWSNSANAGGGAFGSILNNSAFTANHASGTLGGATRSCVLTNCTLSYNFSLSGFGSGGSSSDALYNCIVYFNTGGDGTQKNFDSSSILRYCCSSPLPSGTGNISNAPQFQIDGIRLATNSPCLGKGNSAFIHGVDIDGQNFSTPPAMGCDEWHPEPTVIAPAILGVGSRVGDVTFSVKVFGHPPMTCWWSKDGVPIDDGLHYSDTHSNTFLIRSFTAADAGLYQIVVSNAFGLTTNQIAQLSVHCVDASGTNSSKPYAGWDTAATNIQDATDAAYTGDVVLVTNGIYANGGAKELGTNFADRVLVPFQVIISSVNGAEKTIIEGQWDPVATNGPGSIRCASVSGVLSGFTLRNGSTASSGFYSSGGGGVFNSGVVAFCILSNNVSVSDGGGAFSSGVLEHCVIVSNSAAGSGGGAASPIPLPLAMLNNSLVSGNSAGSHGGGCSSMTLNNCTVTLNSSRSSGGGAYSSALTNCIVYFNSDSTPESTSANYASAVMQYCCSVPLPSGASNISGDPQLVDAFHLAFNSPCQGIGMPSGSNGTDLDGEPWFNPPSVGCDEIVQGDGAGLLSVALSSAWPQVAVGGNLPLTGQVIGRASRLEWSFGDGITVTNASYFTTHTWTNSGDYTVMFSAFNADNPGGVTTNLLIHVAALQAPLISVDGLSGATFNFRFQDQPGVTYIIEQTTNFLAPITWQTLKTVTGSGNTLQIADPGATNASRFYRVRIQ